MNKRKGHIENHLPLEVMVAYRDGKLSDNECHRIEKHLLKCPLCEEAMEGLEHYPGSKSFMRDVDTLKSRIADRTRPSRRIRRVKMLAAAATILVLISVGVYFSVTGIDRSRDTQVAEKKVAKKLKKPLVEPSKSLKEKKNIESNSPLSDSAVANGLYEVDADMEAPQSTNEPVVSEDQVAEVEAEEILEYDMDAGYAESTDEKQQQIATIQGKVQDERGEPVPFANVAVEGTDKGAITNEEGAFKVEVPKGEYKLAVSSVGMDSEKVSVATGDSVSVVMETSQVALNEVVVNDNASMIAETENSKTAKQEETENRLLPAPAGGEKKLEKYFAKNLRYPEKALAEGVSGRVVVEFWVHEDGSVSDIKVVNGLGYGCDEEAARLLIDGPKWKPGKLNGEASTMKRSVVIRFVLPE